MLKKMTFLLFFICTHSLCHSIAAEELISSDTTKKYTLSICAVFNNEAHHLKEWIEHHRLMGIDHFYLYNIGSRDDFWSILVPYFNDEIVTLINWPVPVGYVNSKEIAWELKVQVPAYENAVNFVAREESKWLILMDINEFLICPKGNLTDLIMAYDDFSGISLSSNIEGTAVVSVKKIFSQSSEHTNSETQIANKTTTKMIFKPDQCMGFIWPPYQCRFKTEQPCIEANPHELRINQYLNRNKNELTNNTSLKKTSAPKVKEYGFEQNMPVYIVMPEFLKRLKRI